MQRPPPWIIAVSLAAVGLLVAGAAWGDELVDMLPEDLWGKKALSGAKLAWLRSLAADSRGVLAAASMPAAVAFGQAAVETGWGSAGRNNPWGQRGRGDAGSDLITTTECFKAGADCTNLTGQQFAKYSSQTAAALGYIKFLSGPSYKEGWPYRNADPGRWLLWLWGMGYATANHYASSVVDASRKVAVSLNDASLAINWTDAHQAIADQLSSADAGSQRRALTRKLLGGA